MFKVSEIYDKYKIMPSLQLHMLRVAAVATLICDNFTEPLDRESIILGSLFHDMGNIIKFDLNVFPEFALPEGVEYWQGVKDEYVKKYNNNEHIATNIIVEEIGLSEIVCDLIRNIGFSKSTENEHSNFFARKICNYSDMRVGPLGVMLLNDRILEGNKRYQGRKKTIASDNFSSLAQSAQNVEKQIFEKCRIKPEDITDELVAPIIEELKSFVVK